MNRMASKEEAEREAAILRDELYLAADSGLYPEEQEIISELNLSVAAAVRRFTTDAAGDGDHEPVTSACAAARRALDDLEAGDTDGLQHLVRRVAEATEALESAG
jgi:hypothetical protein